MTSDKTNALPPELAAIHAEAEALAPAATAAQGPAEDAPPPPDYHVDAKGLTDFVAAGLSSIYPSTANVLTEAKRAEFAAALAPVMEKYGMSLGVVFGRWGAEINLAFVTATMAIPMANAIRDDRAKAKAEERPAEAVSRPADPQPSRPANDAYAAAFPGAGQ